MGLTQEKIPGQIDLSAVSHALDPSCLTVLKLKAKFALTTQAFMLTFPNVTRHLLYCKTKHGCVTVLPICEQIYRHTVFCVGFCAASQGHQETRFFTLSREIRSETWFRRITIVKASRLAEGHLVDY